MKRGDIYLVSLNPKQGREQQGHRPVLIVSPSAFNAASKLPVVLPITNGGDFAVAMSASSSRQIFESSTGSDQARWP